MADELVDVIDENHQEIGQALKSVVHKLGLWHYSMHCWIYRTDPETGQTYLLFQERASSKSFYPNCYDASVGGHVAAGESGDDALREVQEEIGLDINRDKLRYLGLRTEVTLFDSVNHKEFCHVYLLETDAKPTDLTLQADEVSGVVEVPVDQGLALCAGEIPQLEAHGVKRANGRQELYATTITVKDFLPRPDRYYQKMFLFASMAGAGDNFAKYLAI